MKHITLLLILFSCWSSDLSAQTKPKKKITSTTKQTKLEQKIQAKYDQRKQIVQDIALRRNNEIEKAKGYNFNPYEKSSTKRHK